MDTDHNLLFAVLALQADLIDADRLARGCALWAADKTRPIASVFVEQGWLTSDDRADVEKLLARKLARHGGNIKSSLAEVTSEQVRYSLAGVSDAGVRQTLAETLHPPALARVLLTTDYVPATDERYTLSRLHATGGIGRVWLAHDASLGRDVALKELRPERAGDASVRQRFLREAQITGQLEHPGVVPIYEVGRRSGDAPFYTMRFVRGRTLAEAIATHHAREARGEATPLGLHDLLTAFVGVCNAVAYAHSRGVLHRDLKPQNVVLGDFGEVMVLDWGLAKVGDGGESEAPLDLPNSEVEGTLQGQVLGTPAYMAPEQAEGRLDQLTTRSDVYGLGAILYQVLTGRPPFSEPDTVKLLRRITHEAVTPPTVYVRDIPRALQAVCLKALSKSPADRYGSAREVGDEARRWLADEPVVAYPEPFPRRAGRWVRRHKLLVSGIGILLLATIPLLVLLNVNAHRAREQAEADRNAIRQQRERSDAVREFFQKEVFSQVRPKGQGLGKDVTMKAVLDAAVPKVGPAFAEHPEDEAAILHVLGKCYLDLGLPDQAEPLTRRTLELRRRALGDYHPDTADSLVLEGDTLVGQGQYDRAVELLRPAIPELRRTLGDEHITTRNAMTSLAIAHSRKREHREAVDLLRARLEVERRRFGDDHDDTLGTMGALGGTLFQLGEYTESERLLRQAWDGMRRLRPTDDVHSLSVLSNLSAALQLQGKFAEAEPMLRQVIAHRRKILGDEHPQTLLSLHNLGSLLRERPDLEGAEAAFREALLGRRNALSPDHPSTIGTQFQLADLLRIRGKLDEAETLARELIGFQKKLKPEAPGRPGDLALLGGILLVRGRAVDAEKTLREALDIFKKEKREGTNGGLQATSLLGGALAAQKRFDEAAPLLLKSYEGLKAGGTAPPSQRREAVERIVRFYDAWGKPDAARWRSELDSLGNSPQSNDR